MVILSIGILVKEHFGEFITINLLLFNNENPLFFYKVKLTFIYSFKHYSEVFIVIK